MRGKRFAKLLQRWSGEVALLLVLIVIIGGTAYALAGNSVNSAWVGVVGTALGGLIGFATSWFVHRSERDERVGERLRAEKKEAYAELLKSAEHSFHLFQWLAEGEISPDGIERDKARANIFTTRK